MDEKTGGDINCRDDRPAISERDDGVASSASDVEDVALGGARSRG
jgi:hypothetical protein